MPIFSAIGEIIKNLTVNENASSTMSDADAEKEAEAIVLKYNKDIEEKEKELGRIHISLDEKEEEEGIVPQAQVNEILAGQTAIEVKKQKDEKEQTQENQIGE